MPSLTSLATAASGSAESSGLPGWLILIGALLMWVVGYRISIRLHPYRPCKACGFTGKHFGSVYRNAFRRCGACGGTGRELRRFAKDPTRS